MIIQENKSLKSFNTFGVETKAKYYANVKNLNDLKELFNHSISKENELLFLGGGSNLLFLKDFDGLCIHVNLEGKSLISEDKNHIFVKASAGENWHEFVLWTLKNRYYGLENLSLIPGKVGATPIQNIGAYGVEMKDFFFELEAFDIENKKVVIFSYQDCKFGYRDSVFKNEFKNKFIILSVTFKLFKEPNLKLEYGAIKRELENLGGEITPELVSKAVINIRSSKLPDPKKIGNGGSFFKNPVVSKAEFEKVQSKFPDVVSYDLGNGYLKLAAGWLIDNAGWRGFRDGDIGVHPSQALVLVNYGNGSGKEVYELSQKIQKDIFAKYGVQLEREVNVL